MADIKETIKALEDYEPYAEHFRAITVESSVLLAALELLKEQEDMGKELTDAIELIHKKNAKIIELKVLLKEQEVREMTIDEWREWKANPKKRNPICMLRENDTSPMWILDPNDVHEPALLMGKLKLFTGKPTFERCKEVKWE